MAYRYPWVLLSCLLASLLGVKKTMGRRSGWVFIEKKGSRGRGHEPITKKGTGCLWEGWEGVGGPPPPP